MLHFTLERIPHMLMSVRFTTLNDVLNTLRVLSVLGHIVLGYTCVYFAVPKPGWVSSLGSTLSGTDH